MEMAKQFRDLTKGAMKHEVGAIDGCVCGFEGKPKVDNPVSYYNTRKQKYAVIVTAIADTRGRCIHLDTRCIGNVHDSTAVASSSELAPIVYGIPTINDGEPLLPWPYHLNGDAAYRQGRAMLTPVGGTNRSERDSAGDYWQSRGRIPSEWLFGYVSNRFPQVQKLPANVPRAIKSLDVSFRLHNWLVDQRDGQDDLGDDGIESDDVPEPSSLDVLLETDVESRNRIYQQLYDEGYRRPASS